MATVLARDRAGQEDPSAAPGAAGSVDTATSSRASAHFALGAKDDDGGGGGGSNGSSSSSSSSSSNGGGGGGGGEDDERSGRGGSSTTFGVEDGVDWINNDPRPVAVRLPRKTRTARAGE